VVLPIFIGNFGRTGACDQISLGVRAAINFTLRRRLRPGVAKLLFCRIAQLISPGLVDRLRRRPQPQLDTPSVRKSGRSSALGGVRSRVLAAVTATFAGFRSWPRQSASFWVGGWGKKKPGEQRGPSQALFRMLGNARALPQCEVPIGQLGTTGSTVNERPELSRGLTISLQRPHC
jgi:hypothetical protein